MTLEEIEKEIAADIDGGKYVLRFWAINYGTHVGSTIKLSEAGSAAPFAELSFETHWNAAGRYILRIGSVKGEDGALLAASGANVLKKYADIFSTARSLDDVFAQVKANANALLWAAGDALAQAREARAAN